jgi:twitching motility protein PilT
MNFKGNPMFIETLASLLENTEVSDIHLESDTNIWVRQGGDLCKLELQTSEAALNQWLGSRYKDANIVAELIAMGGQDDFALNVGRMRIRGHAYVSRGRLEVSLRRLATEIPPLSTLGLPSSVPELIAASQGLFLVTGPTGSGKSTSMAAMVDSLNETTPSHIITLEEPIEYIYKDKKSRIRQRLVSERSDGDCTSFAAGVVAAMREDPDIILVGEMRDYATVQAALTAAQTGHLVFGSLHTNGGMETVNRILSFYKGSDRDLARSVLSAVLRGVVSQRLLKKKGGGRVLAAELLINTTAVRSQIAQDTTHLIQQELNTGSSVGQIALNRSLSMLVRENVIDREVALVASNDRASLEKEFS